VPRRATSTPSSAVRCGLSTSGASRVTSRKTFLSGVNELVAQTPACVPVVPLTVIPSRGRGNNHGNKGHGKHGEHGD